jgi:hypothetical protein
MFLSGPPALGKLTVCYSNEILVACLLCNKEPQTNALPSPLLLYPLITPHNPRSRRSNASISPCLQPKGIYTVWGLAPSYYLKSFSFTLLPSLSRQEWPHLSVDVHHSCERGQILDPRDRSAMGTSPALRLDELCLVREQFATGRLLHMLQNPTGISCFKDAFKKPTFYTFYLHEPLPLPLSLGIAYYGPMWM